MQLHLEGTTNYRGQTDRDNIVQHVTRGKVNYPVFPCLVAMSVIYMYFQYFIFKCIELIFSVFSRFIDVSSLLTNHMGFDPIYGKLCK